MLAVARARTEMNFIFAIEFVCRSRRLLESECGVAVEV